MKINFENYEMFIAHRQGGLIDERFRNCTPEIVSGRVFEVIQSINVTEDIYNALKSDKGIFINTKLADCWEFNREKNTFKTTTYSDIFNKPIEIIGEAVNKPIIEYSITGEDKGDKELVDCITGDDLSNDVSFYIRLIAFKQLTDINELIIANDKKHGYKSSKSNGEEVFSTDFKFPIRVLDSKYIRTLIRSGQFHVRGFFRLQPVGKGRARRKLTWVREHVREKHNILRQSM